MSLTARIVTNDGFRLVGFKHETTNENNLGVGQIPAFWQEVVEANGLQTIVPLMNQVPAGVIGMCVYNTDTDDARKFDYYIGCATSWETPEKMSDYHVPAATWAIFDCQSAVEMARILPLIVTEWQPNSGYVLVNRGYETGEMTAPLPDIEVYPDQTGSVQVWIAVEAKNNE